MPIRWVLVRDPKNRFASHALLCTDLDRKPVQIVYWFVQRWCVEVTFQEARAHLGVGTQRQWSNKVIVRTAPCPLSLFSIVSLLASRLPAHKRTRVVTAAWYAKPKPIFGDALAAMRYTRWYEQASVLSRRQRHRPKPRFVLSRPSAYAFCQAA